MIERIRELNLRFKALAPATEADLRDENERLQSDLTAAKAEIERLRAALHAWQMHPDFEYATTDGPRKAWYDEDVSPEGDGWEPNIHRGDKGWERFDYHEEAYWMRLRQQAEAAEKGGDDEPT